MPNLLKPIKKKINQIVFSFSFTGVTLLVLGFLMVWTKIGQQLFIIMMGLIIIVIAFSFFYWAYKIWAIKRDVEKYLKF